MAKSNTRQISSDSVLQGFPRAGFLQWWEGMTEEPEMRSHPSHPGSRESKQEVGVRLQISQALPSDVLPSAKLPLPEAPPPRLQQRTKHSGTRPMIDTFVVVGDSLKPPEITRCCPSWSQIPTFTLILLTCPPKQPGDRSMPPSPAALLSCQN